MNEVRLIDANAVDVSQTVKGISDFAECIRDAVQTTLDNAPTVDAIEIPQNVTNGDMIKIMFPNIEIEGIGGEIKCIAAQIGFGTSYFALDWWNAPYKGGRSMTKFDLNKVYNLEDMLQGNVNRMCVTHDMKELNDMRAWAENRIAEIFEMNYARINEEIENLPVNVEEDGEEEGEEW